MSNLSIDDLKGLPESEVNAFRRLDVVLVQANSCTFRIGQVAEVDEHIYTYGMRDLLSKELTYYLVHSRDPKWNLTKLAREGKLPRKLVEVMLEMKDVI